MCVCNNCMKGYITQFLYLHYSTSFSSALRGDEKHCQAQQARPIDLDLTGTAPYKHV